MPRRLASLLQLVRTELKTRKAFYRNAADESASSNLRILLASNMASIVFLVGFILLTPHIISGWQPTPYHIWFLPAMFFCTIITFLYFLRRPWQNGIILLLCILFILFLLIFSILLDSVGTPDGSGTFFPMMLIIIPSLFTLPLYISYGLCVAAEIAYIFVTTVFKATRIGQYDIFSSVVALAFSFIVANMIMTLKVRDRTMQSKYRHLSMTDNLTDILNKTASFAAFQEYLDSCGSAVTCTLVVMDLDHFKALNDTRGHAAGDRVLHQFGLLLKDVFRKDDIIGRFGGDEFVVLLKGVASRALLQKFPV